MNNLSYSVRPELDEIARDIIFEHHCITTRFLQEHIYALQELRIDILYNLYQIECSP